MKAIFFQHYLPFSSSSDLLLTTEFVKVPGGDRGGHWAARISAKSTKVADGDSEDRKMNLMVYLGNEGYSSLDCETPLSLFRID